MTAHAFLAAFLMLAASLSFANRAAASAADTIQFQISNQQADALGEVTISTSVGDYYLNVGSNETDFTQIGDTALSVTINGQTIPQGQKALIQLPSGEQVEVMWPAPNAIDVIDEGEPD